MSRTERTVDPFVQDPQPGEPAQVMAWGPLLLLAGGLVAILVALSGRYGYHRDELYFLEAGSHPAWGYPDQPALTPMLARWMSALAPESLVVLRLPSAIAAAAVVVLTALMARAFGGGRGAQLLAASSMATSALLLVVSHMLSTATFDLLAWTALTYLVVRQLSGADERGWLLVGLVAGLALNNKALPAFLLVALALAVLVTGPRAVFRSAWFWAGGAIALALAAPNLLWQATNGWPQLELSRAIAAGSSGSSESPWLFVPMQLVMVSPLLAPIWITGLAVLGRSATFRCLPVAFVVLAAVFQLTGGKPYYLGGIYPVLLAAGAAPILHWLRGRRFAPAVITGALALSAGLNGLLMLPLVPVSALASTPIVDVNYDAGETVGWPAFTQTIGAVHRALPDEERAAAVVVTRNYGQAGAVDHYGPSLDLPAAHSGHNAYFGWGPPPDTGGPTLAIGFDEAFLRTQFGEVELAARVDNGVGLDNEEQGTPVWICRDQRASWAERWPAYRLLR